MCRKRTKATSKPTHSEQNMSSGSDTNNNINNNPYYINIVPESVDMSFTNRISIPEIKTPQDNKIGNFNITII